MLENLQIQVFDLKKKLNKMGIIDDTRDLTFTYPIVSVKDGIENILD